MIKIKNFITNCNDIKLFSSISEKQLEKTKLLNLPYEHLELLMLSNGLEFFGGYYRLFGADEKKHINLFSWNSTHLWKITWGKHVESYYFFGMSAIGDLFAYGLDSDRKILKNKVYYLDGTTMDIIDIYGSFYEFFENEFINRYKGVMEEILVLARNKFGNLDTNISLIHTPTLFFADTPSVDNLMKIPTIDMMTINGDLCNQLIDTEEQVKYLEHYIDENGRARVKVIWKN